MFENQNIIPLLWTSHLMLVSKRMIMILRIYNIESMSIEINEYLLGVMAVDDSTGFGLAEACLKKLEDLILCLENCRGQGYGNGANMKGCNRGLQNVNLNSIRNHFM